MSDDDLVKKHAEWPTTNARADEAVERVRARALSMLRPGDELAIATDTETFARGAKPAVLLAIARPTASVVIAINASEYTWEEVAFFGGWDLKPVSRAVPERKKA